MILGADVKLRDQFSSTLTSMDKGIAKGIKGVKTLNSTKAKPVIQAEDKLTGEITRITKRLNALKANPEIKANDKLTGEITKTMAKLKALNSARANPEIRAVDKVSGEITKATAKLKILGNMAVRPVVSIRDNITSNIGRIKGALTGLAVLAAGGFGLFALTEKAVEAGDNLYVLSTKLNVSAEEASLLGRVLKLTNIEAKPLISTIVRLDKSIETAGKNGNAATDAMSEFGLSLTDAEGNLLSIPKQLEKMAAAYQKAVDVGKEEDFVATVLGSRGMELVPLLADYTMAMEAASQVKGIGIDPKKAHEQAVAMRVLKLEVGQVGLCLADAFLPFAKQITPMAMTAFSKLAENIKAHSGEIKQITDGMGVWVNQTVDKITAKFNDPGFQSLDWGGKITAMLEEAGAIAGPVAFKIGKGIAASFASAIAAGLVEAIKSDPKVGIILGLMTPGPWQVKAAVATALATPSLLNNAGAEFTNPVTEFNDRWQIRKGAGFFGGAPDKENLIKLLNNPPGKAAGIPRVPYDNYPALLHQGERVMTASENRQFDGGGTSGNTPSVNITINAANMNEDQIVSMVENRLLQIAMNMGAA